MTTGLFLLVGGIALGFAHLLIASHAASLQRGYRWAAGPRDEVPDQLTGLAGRLSRAQQNFNETFPFFAAALLIAHIAGKENALALAGAWTYLGGRVAYLAAYASGIFLLRSLIWNVPTIGIFMIIVALR